MLLMHNIFKCIKHHANLCPRCFGKTHNRVFRALCFIRTLKAQLCPLPQAFFSVFRCCLFWLQKFFLSLQLQTLCEERERERRTKHTDKEKNNGNDVLCKQKVQIENILLQLPRAYLNKLVRGESESQLVQFVLSPSVLVLGSWSD